MAIKIKKITFRVVLLSFALVGFFAGIFSRVFLGSSVDLGKLESKSNDVFSKNLDSSIPVVQADVASCGGSGDVTDTACEGTGCVEGTEGCGGGCAGL